MPSANFMVPVYYLRQIADHVRDAGGDVTRWLEQNQLRASQLADAQLMLPFASFRRLVLDAQALSGDAAIGLRVGARLGVNAHGILSFAVISSSTLRQTLELFERYIALRTPLVSASHRIEGGEVLVQFQTQHPLGEIEHIVLEAVILTVKNVFDYVIAGDHQLGMVAFPHPEPGYAALAQQLFQTEVRWDQNWAGFSLPLAALDQPLKMADELSCVEAANICQSAYESLSRSETMAARIRKTLHERRREFPTLNELADSLHLTPRTLHRRLLDEGTSYNEILEEVRHVLAVEYLKAGQLDMQEIAYELGYSDLSNFRRAFKRWEGVSPSAWKSTPRGQC